MRNEKNHGEAKRELPTEEQKKKSLRKWGLLLALVLLTLLFFVVYRVLLERLYFIYVLYVYTAVEVGLILGYLIYNRGLSRRNLTKEMLPDTWSEEEKEDFLRDGRERLRKSRWMLLLILPILFTFAIDYVEFFFVPMITGWFR